MKNIHVLPTDKPSRLGYIFESESYHIFTNEENPCDIADNLAYYRNIYITNSEDIKEGDYILIHGHYKHGKHVTKVINITDTYEVIEGGNHVKKACQKIILTTDPKLIEDGVQGIDNEIVMWFINNPTCEHVKVDEYNTFGVDNWKYLITIPEDIVKEQTIEEIVETLDTKQMDELDIFLKGVEWKDTQNKELYDDLVDLLERLRPIYREDSDLHLKYEQKRLDLIEVLKKK
jgi:hypothetical protein